MLEIRQVSFFILIFMLLENFQMYINLSLCIVLQYLDLFLSSNVVVVLFMLCILSIF